jgi:hypothetical protein
VPGSGAAAAAADSSMGESSAALQLELQRLEQHLCVEDILLCRSLAELALERRSSSSGECQPMLCSLDLAPQHLPLEHYNMLLQDELGMWNGLELWGMDLMRGCSRFLHV